MLKKIQAIQARLNCSSGKQAKLASVPLMLRCKGCREDTYVRIRNLTGHIWDSGYSESCVYISICPFFKIILAKNYSMPLWHRHVVPQVPSPPHIVVGPKAKCMEPTIPTAICDKLRRGLDTTCWGALAICISITCESHTHTAQRHNRIAR